MLFLESMQCICAVYVCIHIKYIYIYISLLSSKYNYIITYHKVIDHIYPIIRHILWVCVCVTYLIRFETCRAVAQIRIQIIKNLENVILSYREASRRKNRSSLGMLSCCEVLMTDMRLDKRNEMSNFPSGTSFREQIKL